MFVVAFNLLLFFASLVWILSHSKRVRVGFMPAILVAPGVALTILLSGFGAATAGQAILVGPTGVTFLERSKHASIDRDKLDITYETAWLGPGFYWGFYGPSSSGGSVPSNAVYLSSDHELLSGDDVAKRLAIWSGTTPRHIVNGDPRDWHNPHAIARNLMTVG
jgi:hypothetical protein